MTRELNQGDLPEGWAYLPVSMEPELKNAVDAYAKEHELSQSMAERLLLQRGMTSLFAGAFGGVGTETRESFKNRQSAPRLTKSLVITEVLPRVCFSVCGDARWFDAAPTTVRSDMGKTITQHFRSNGKWMVPLDELIAGATELATNARAPWVVGNGSRQEVLSLQDGRIMELLERVDDSAASQEEWAELGWRSAICLVYAVADVAGVPPKGPLQVLSAITPGGTGGQLTQSAKQLRDDAGEKLRVLLDVDVAELMSVGKFARAVLASGIFEGTSGGEADGFTKGAPKGKADASMNDASQGDGPGDAAESGSESKADDSTTGTSNKQPGDSARSAIQALAGYALMLAGNDAGRKYIKNATNKATDAAACRQSVLLQKGTQQLVDYVTEHPRAHIRELMSVTGLSHSTLKKRIDMLEDAGLVRNARTGSDPLWDVLGVEHTVKELLSEREAFVLDKMLQDPPVTTAGIAAEMGCSVMLVNGIYHELEETGLVAKENGRWVAKRGAALDAKLGEVRSPEL